MTGLSISSLCCNLDVFGTGGVLDNNVEVLVKYDGGASGMYWTSQVAIGFDNALKIRVFGEKGTLEFVQEENKMCIRDRCHSVLLFSSLEDTCFN